jgi:hypothetical protein
LDRGKGKPQQIRTLSSFGDADGVGPRVGRNLTQRREVVGDPPAGASRRRRMTMVGWWRLGVGRLVRVGFVMDPRFRGDERD